MPFLTIGMPTYDDFDGVYFTIQALRLYQDLHHAELLVVDTFGCESTRSFVSQTPGAKYALAAEAHGPANAKNLVFTHASGDFVLCIDSHVLLAPDAIARLVAYGRRHPTTPNLLQGPLWLDDLGANSVATHLSMTWSDGMLGQWETDARGVDLDASPFEIRNQGMGLFACRRDSWPGFNPRFAGFGGEEGYLQAKFRQRGDVTLCLPFLRWVHRFGRPHGVPYKVRSVDKFRNYLIGHLETGLDLVPCLAHFGTILPAEVVHDLVWREFAEGQWESLGWNRTSIEEALAAASQRAEPFLSERTSTDAQSPPRG